MFNRFGSYLSRLNICSVFRMFISVEHEGSEMPASQIDGDPEGIGRITTGCQIEALANPLRTRILRHAREPITVAVLAERFGIPPTRLYYHVNLLVNEGMLVQVDERKSGARIEKIYLRTAGDFRLGPELAEEIGDTRKAAAAATGLLFDPSRADVEDLIEKVFSGAEPTGSFGRTVVRLRPDDATRFTERIEELMNELRTAAGATSDGTVTYSYLSAFVPIDTIEETS